MTQENQSFLQFHHLRSVTSCARAVTSFWQLVLATGTDSRAVTSFCQLVLATGTNF
jgi:hypothetical protein